MAQITREYFPNPVPFNASPGDTNWHVCSSDPANPFYDTVALLLAAGKKCYPGLSNGGKLGTCLIHSVNAAGTAAGSGVLYKRDTTTTPTQASDADNLVGGSDQQVNDAEPMRILWVKNITAGDRIIVDGRH
jgi:hypothetical protein